MISTYRPRPSRFASCKEVGGQLTFRGHDDVARGSVPMVIGGEGGDSQWHQRVREFPPLPFADAHTGGFRQCAAHRRDDGRVADDQAEILRRNDGSTLDEIGPADQHKQRPEEKIPGARNE